MKRDMDFARDILLAIEAKPDDSEYPLIPGKASEQEIYHVMLLAEAGLIEANKIVYDNRSVEWRIRRLTSQGHDFLDAARDQNRWNQAKRMISEKGGSLTFDILKGVLVQLMRQAVGL